MKFVCRAPGARSRRIIARDRAAIAQCLTREYSFVFSRSRGCYVWDVDGRRYLDFGAGVAVMNVGHSNREVMRAIAAQTRRAAHCGFADFYAEPPVEFAETLLAMLPRHLNQAFLSNSGTEAVEAAYKLARWHTNRRWTVAFENAFHGRTMGSLSMTKSQPVQRERYAPFLPVVHACYPYVYRFRGSEAECTNHCLDKVEDALRAHRGDTAAVFLEAVQGEGGYIVPPAAFVRGVRKLCNEHGALLCDDEVQAGCFRTGRFLAIENFGVKPDIVALSKAIGGGIPLGATVANKKLQDWVPGSHASTFGGNLLACAGGIASLKFMRRKRLGANAVRIGRQMMKRLGEMRDRYEIVGDVRGLGLMIGVEIVKDKRSKKYNRDGRHAILCRASEKGLIILPCGRSTIRICPPLIITKREAERGLDILEDAVAMVQRGEKVKYS